MAKNKNKAAGPAWKNHQQKVTGSKNSEQRAKENSKNAKASLVKIRMKTDYRDIVKVGQVWETDNEKAAELVKLGRAEYVK